MWLPSNESGGLYNGWISTNLHIIVFYKSEELSSWSFASFMAKQQSINQLSHNCEYMAL
jgi:hypothetical protein